MRISASAAHRRLAERASRKLSGASPLYDPGTPDGCLLLGLKRAIFELELHTVRGRLTPGLLGKAARGELAPVLPASCATPVEG
jgi:DNA invertase Pin-like site-specific DNA recombinase